MAKLTIPKENIDVVGADKENLDIDKILSSISTMGFYDEETGEYTSDTEPLENGWELVVGKKFDINEEKITVHNAYLFSPDCLAKPEIVFEGD
mgnify:CR=1 FL=1